MGLDGADLNLVASVRYGLYYTDDLDSVGIYFFTTVGPPGITRGGQRTKQSGITFNVVLQRTA